jgi:5-deoxy-glucuronate isomerase
MGTNSAVHSHELPLGVSGDLLRFSRQDAGWQWMEFCVKRLVPGETWQQHRSGEEAVYVLLSGKFTAEWDRQKEQIGERSSVFDGLPYALYASPGTRVRFESLTICEIAECNVPSQTSFRSRLVSPKDVVVSLRGGGHASRQIVDIIRPEFSGGSPDCG